MKYLPFIVICLVSCQSKNSTEEKKDSVVAEEAPPENVYYSSKETPGGTSDTPTIKLISSIENFDIFIDAGTSLYTGASLESEIIKELTEFTPAIQIQRTSAREPEDYGTCSHYFWYEVKLNDGTKG